MKTCKLMLIAMCLSLFLFSCNSKSSDAPANSMSAKIGSTSFSASGSSVVGLIAANPDDNSVQELSVTGASGTSVLTVAVFEYKGTTGTFDFSSGAALGGYGSTTGTSDDIITSGSVTITSVTDHQVKGTFSGTTDGGVSITGGSFSFTK